jgi:osmotically-inducible protein OsmY
MLRKETIPDRLIDQKVGQQLANRGMRPPCKVTASSRGGTVTLSGQIQYEHQRNLCVRTTSNIEGVLRVVDQLQVTAKTSHWDPTPNSTNPRQQS